MDFLLLLTRVTSCDLNLWEGHNISQPLFQSHKFCPQSHQLCPTYFVFIERESWSQPYYVFVGLPPSLFNLGFL